MFLTAAMQISEECETHKALVRNTKHLNLHQPKTYMWKYRAGQHLIVLNLHSISINKILVSKFMKFHFTSPNSM